MRGTSGISSSGHKVARVTKKKVVVFGVFLYGSSLFEVMESKYEE